MQMEVTFVFNVDSFIQITAPNGASVEWAIDERAADVLAFVNAAGMTFTPEAPGTTSGDTAH